MFPTHKVVKKTALTGLKNNWPGAIAAAMLFVFLCIIGSLVASLLQFATNLFIANLVLAALTIFVIFPFFLGVLGFFRAIAFDESAEIKYIFYPFIDTKNYFRALSFSVNFILRLFFVCFAALLPAIITRVLSYNSTYKALGGGVPLWAPGLSVVSVMLGIAGAALSFVVLLRYYAAPFLFVANENLYAKEALKASRKITMGRKADFFFLMVSLLGWIALSLLCLPLIFTAPYFFMVYIVHCRFSVAAYNKSIKEI